MQIGKDTVVSISYDLFDASGKLIEMTPSPVSYLHGGYDAIFPQVEYALDGKRVGDACEVRMEPEDAFGECDEKLVRVEPRDHFPEDNSVGMQFEGALGGDHEQVVYTVTDIAEDRVVVDGNHALSGQVLVFICTVTGVREAISEELAHGHVPGPHGHQH